MSTAGTAGKIELQAEFCIPVDHPCLAGHFPGKPLIPAVVLLDLLFTELLSRIKTHPGNTGHVAWRLTRIVTARFHTPWLPDEPLTVQMRFDLATQRAQMHAFVATREVASATVQLTLAAGPEETTT